MGVHSPQEGNYLPAFVTTLKCSVLDLICFLAQSLNMANPKNAFIFKK